MLLSDIPSYREVWGGAACFFRSDSVQDLRGAWQRLLRDGALRADLQRRARRHALEHYGIARMAEQYLHTYRRTPSLVAV